MHPDIAVEFGREAVLTCLTLAAPMLIVGILVAVVVGILQSITQVQDQTVSFIPKVVLVAVTFLMFLPWLSDRFIDYSRELFLRPGFVSVSSPKQQVDDDERQIQPDPGSERSRTAGTGRNRYR